VVAEWPLATSESKSAQDGEKELVQEKSPPPGIELDALFSSQQ
jgi:hypothetical protein